jgi:aldose 1-epimerase
MPMLTARPRTPTSGVPQPFGRLPDGAAARLYTLENDRLRVRITDYGGRIVSIEAPDRRGQREDVLLGFDDAAQYATAGGAFGALLGRNANRIAGGELTIDGVSYRLPQNDRGNTLHGGPGGFDKLVWLVGAASSQELNLSLVSPDGDQGFPGELTVDVRYHLDGDSLALDFVAWTTTATVVSLSAHPYLNLAGAASGDILGHRVTIPADAFLPTDAVQIPTGEVRPVEGTLFDLRRPVVTGSRIRRADEQLLHGQGYDHYFVLVSNSAAAERFAARLEEPESGRMLEIFTDQPGLQFYTGNQLNGTFAGRGGAIYRQSAGLAFEPQGFPDAPHHSNFPITILRPGERYRAAIRYRFTAA